MSDSGSSVGGFFLIALVCILGLVVLIGGCAAATSFKGTESSEVCVVKRGGPLDGRDVKEVRQPAESPKIIGAFNKQFCFPSNERSYTFSTNPQEADAKAVDVFHTPTVDAVEVYIAGQARFKLTTDPKLVEKFYISYGNRTYDGNNAYDGGDGWNSFLEQVFRPQLQNALRDAIGQYQCVELKNTCQYVQNAEAVTKGEVEEINSSQELAKVEAQVAEQLRVNIKNSLGDDYFEAIRFNITGVEFDDAVEQQVVEAQTKRTEVANARLEAERAREEAEGRTAVARENAKAIQVKAKSYGQNPDQADIDKLKALCGESGCTNIQVVGGSVTKLLK